MMYGRTSNLFLGLLALLICGPARGEPLFHFDLKGGPYAVGLKVVEQYDRSRVYRGAVDALGKPYVGERARPLQTLIWYPAKASHAPPMKVKDYVDLLATETDFAQPQQKGSSTDFVEGMKPTYASPMWAVANAAPAAGRFPVVIYAPSIDAMSWENADLCEYLASHGYVVIATPDFGARTRLMGVDDLPGAEAEAADIEFLIGYAQSLPDTDMSKVAVAAFSWGGMANLLAAAHDDRIRAMAELDTSFRYYPGLVKDAGYVHPDQMTIPLLYLSHGEISEEDVARRNKPSQLGPSVLNAWTHGDLIYVNMRGFVHGEFSSMYQRNENFWKYFPQTHVADYTREDGATGYGWVVRYVLAFLDDYLKGDAAAATFLTNSPTANGAPANFIAVNYRKAKGLAPSFDTLQAEVGKQGFGSLNKIYAEIKKDTPDFKPDATRLSGWADDLETGGHTPEAIDVLKFIAETDPSARNIYIRLGDAYAETGQKPLAIESYKLQLVKTPGNLVALDKLKAMGG
jgi:dienelactone hydrolase